MIFDGHDMTEKLLKVALSPNTTIKTEKRVDKSGFYHIIHI